MNAKTRQSLIDLNRLFYAGLAEEFSESRHYSWPGWSRALSHLKPPDDHPISVLDVGCGNGRLVSFLEKDLGSAYHYLGLDSSPALLSHALACHASLPHVKFEDLEILDPAVRLAPEGLRFDLIALFGVLHHVPSEGSRRELMQRLVARLRPGGLLIVTAWQFGAFERFRARIIPWEEYNARARDPIDESELEVGDHLLRWGESSLPRYCHFAPPDELRELSTLESAEWVDEFSADGKTGDLNRYLVLRRGRDAND
ncbi:MAG: class I SAM-dependent methyltransferase [Myxococcales bacterium]|nr:class I SAM-dependent methyltransferase [Myxococcales bacterium]